MAYNIYMELENGKCRFIHGARKGARIKIKHYAAEMLPPSCFTNGQVSYSSVFFLFIRELRKKYRIGLCNAYITVKDSSFITRPIELPLSDEKEISRFLGMNAEQYLPVNLENFFLDFAVIEKAAGENGTMGSKLLLSAGPRDTISRLLEAMDRSGLRTKVIDVYPNNISRLFGPLPEKDIAVIDLGAASVNITILENHKFYMHSQIAYDIAAVSGDVLKMLSLNADEIKERYYYRLFDHDLIHAQEESPDDYMLEVLSPLFDQVARYLDYYNSRHFGKTVEKLYFIGDHALIRGLKSYAGSRFNTGIGIGVHPLPLLFHKKAAGFMDDPCGYYNLIGLALRSK